MKVPELKTSLKTYLGVSYFLVVLIGVGLATALTWYSIEGLYVNTQQDNLLAQAKWIAKTVALQPIPAGRNDPYTQTANTISGIHTRLIDAQSAAIIQLDGPAAGFSAGKLELPQFAQAGSGMVSSEELMSRSEIVQALAGFPTTAVRRVEAAGGIPVAYAAVPIVDSAGVVSQIIYLATPLPNTQWTSFPWNVQLQFLMIPAAAILLASAAGIVFARRLSRPLRGVLNTIKSIGTGNFELKAQEDHSILELAQLSQGINQMSTSLRQADVSKSNFIAGVSHELRTPLTVIKGTIETLQDGALDDQEARGPFLEAMYKETERLIHIVHDLLILTRVDSGELRLKPRNFDLQKLAMERWRHLQPMAQLSQISLRIDDCKSHPDGIQVYADSDRTTQILDNLLENAIHYSPEKGEVLIKMSQSGNHVICAINDQGPGIPEEHLPFLFDRFYRVDATRSRDSGGSGLGLAIVRELVEAQGGQVTVESTVGKGTVLTFNLPKAANETKLSPA